MGKVFCLLLVAAALPAAHAFQSSAASAFMGTSTLPAISARSCAKIGGLARSAAVPPLRMQFGGEEEKAKASKELMQIRFTKVDAPKLKEFIQKWPYGSKKDGYGLPKLMLPVQIDKSGDGVKLTFKGSLDPWLQVDLEGDTVRVYRQSMMSTSFMQVSALKEREEKKICEKLKEDLTNNDCGAAEMTERELPKEEKPAPEEEEKEEEGEEATKAEPEAKAE